ncbi:MAG: hypothetical protein MI723_14650 [Caulobacterales bacterium]|nr:hypothetical protein [Caulobacterales bacterium]
MAKFLFVYHGGSKPDAPEEGAEVTAKWRAWFETLGAAVVDGGNPVGESTTVFADRVVGDGGANPASGYSLIAASDMNDAVAKAKGCPLLEAGGSVEIAEAMEM